MLIKSFSLLNIIFNFIFLLLQFYPSTLLFLKEIRTA